MNLIFLYKTKKKKNYLKSTSSKDIEMREKVKGSSFLGRREYMKNDKSNGKRNQENFTAVK